MNGVFEDRTHAESLRVSSGYLSERSCQLVREHLETLLTDPLFNNSKRLPGFLRHVVKESLENGPDSQIKERTLGVVVFGRTPDYDTNADPVVRMTAGEVRKKLAQYYYAHPNADVQIEVPLGGYLPRFRFANPVTAAEPVVVAAPAVVVSPLVVPAQDLLERGPMVVAAEAPARRKDAYVLGFAALAVVMICGFFLWRWMARDTAVDRFWNAFASPSHQVLVVLPALTRAPQALPMYHFEAESVAIEDARVAARMSTELKQRNLNSQLVLASRVSLSDLRNSPFVLIGALDNVWTMRLSQSLPFAFERSDDRRYGRIVDRKDPSRSWTEDFSVPNTSIPVDYGIIARFTDPTTEQPILLIAGISAEGTLAAGEAVTTPRELNMLVEAAGHAPGGFEAVIETKVIDGQSGPPNIVAIRSW